MPAISTPAKDIILRLCCGPEQRLGRYGGSEVRAHPFFAGIQFEGLHSCAAPYKPIIKNPTDTSNFDPVDEHAHASDDSGDLERSEHKEHPARDYSDMEEEEEGGELAQREGPPKGRQKRKGTPCGTCSGTLLIPPVIEFTFRRFFDEPAKQFPDYY